MKVVNLKEKLASAKYVRRAGNHLTDTASEARII